VKKISTIVITHNEEERIGRCLASVAPFSDEIVVVDSFSTDATVEIAREHTALVFQNEWPGYSAQKEYAVERSSGEWIFWIDADEEASPDLQREIADLGIDAEGYLVPRLVRYLGRWIRHGGWYPDHVLRLFRRDRGRFDGARVHERVLLDGTARKLTAPLYHYSYRNIAHHMEKMNQFTSLAAEQMHAQGRGAGLVEIVGRPLAGFLGAYVVRRGFLDGMPGLLIATLHAHYVFLKYAKLWERARSADGRIADDRHTDRS
jgi:glycosyltransferase involved in cell wall biosynthesis